MRFCKHSKGLVPYPPELGLVYLKCNECGVDLSPNIVPVFMRAEVAEREVDELKVHVKNLQKLLGNYALHVEDCEGIDFLSSSRDEHLSESDKDYISECKRQVEKL